MISHFPFLKDQTIDKPHVHMLHSIGQWEQITIAYTDAATLHDRLHLKTRKCVYLMVRPFWTVLRPLEKKQLSLSVILTWDLRKVKVWKQSRHAYIKFKARWAHLGLLMNLLSPTYTFITFHDTKCLIWFLLATLVPYLWKWGVH